MNAPTHKAPTTPTFTPPAGTPYPLFLKEESTRYSTKEQEFWNAVRKGEVKPDPLRQRLMDIVLKAEQEGVIYNFEIEERVLEQMGEHFPPEFTQKDENRRHVRPLESEVYHARDVLRSWAEVHMNRKARAELLQNHGLRIGQELGTLYTSREQWRKCVVTDLGPAEFTIEFERGRQRYRHTGLYLGLLEKIKHTEEHKHQQRLKRRAKGYQGETSEPPLTTLVFDLTNRDERMARTAHMTAYAPEPGDDFPRTASNA